MENFIFCVCDLLSNIYDEVFPEEWLLVVTYFLQNSSHGVNSVRIRSYSGPHFSRIFPHLDRIGRDTPYLSVFSPNAGKSGKSADQNNSKYGLFLHRVY